MRLAEGSSCATPGCAIANREYNTTGCKVKILVLYSIFTNMEFVLKNKAGRKIPPKHSVWLLPPLFRGGKKQKEKKIPEQKTLEGHPDAGQNNSSLYV